MSDLVRNLEDRFSRVVAHFCVFFQDIIITQEEFGKMASEFVKFRKETQAEIHRLKVEIYCLPLK